MESFEEALKRLEEIAKRLENENIMLEEAIGLYEEAEDRIKTIRSIENGKLKTEDFNDE